MNDFLDQLLNTYTPSGYEKLGNINDLKEHVLCDYKYEDKINNIFFVKGHTGDNPFTIFISAHYDENAMQVINITKEGILHIINLGGIDRKTIEGSHVYVISDDWDENDKTRRKLIPGIIGKKPIHKETTDERKEVDELDKICIDIGANSKEEVYKQGIHIGSIIIFKKDINLNFGYDEKKIVSNALDDKIGIYAITETFNKIDSKILKKNKIKLVLGWLSQEEVGLRGAIVAAKNINPNVSIDVDVTFDTSKYTAISKEKWGDIELGKGVVLEYGPHCNYDLLCLLKDLANKYALSYQETVSKPGGNNCSAIQLNSLNCSTAHLGIPIRNMHTQVEICHKDDIDNCSELIRLYIESIIE